MQSTTIRNSFCFEIFKVLGCNFGLLYVSLLYYWHRTYNVGQSGNNEICVFLGSTNKYITRTGDIFWGNRPISIFSNSANQKHRMGSWMLTEERDLGISITWKFFSLVPIAQRLRVYELFRFTFETARKMFSVVSDYSTKWTELKSVIT